ncbi:alpha/beta hydrolase [Actinocorallia aurea]
MSGRARLWLYDRAGLGWSGPARGAVRSVEVLGDELVALLDAAAVAEPVVLIGHSMGGIIARDVAVRYRDRVAGLLLVDSSHELMRAHLGQVNWRREQWAIAARRRLTWYGARRALDDLGWRRMDRTTAEQLFAPEWRETGFAFDVTLTQRRARIAERLGMLRGFAAAHARRRPLGDLPLCVLTVGPEGSARRKRVWPVWLALQTDLASQAEDAVHVTVDYGEHYLHLHRPHAVEAALLDLLARVARHIQS